MTDLCKASACDELAMDNGSGLCEPHFEARREQLKEGFSGASSSVRSAAVQRKKDSPLPVWRRTAKLGLIAMALVAAAFGVRLLLDSNQDFRPGNAPVVEAASARAAVAQRMKDPDSAMFQNERTGQLGAACGEVNARNGYGGYVGYTRFIVILGAAPLIESDPGFIDFEEQWAAICS